MTTEFCRPKIFDTVVWTCAAMFLALFAVHEARADEHRYDVSAPQYREECGSCHVPYPPALLSAAQWREVMGSLDRHYGADAGTDAGARDAITRFVVDRAGREGGAGDGLPRITTGRWFVREHRKAAADFKIAAVKSAGNCGACHRGAEAGDYSKRGRMRPR